MYIWENQIKNNMKRIALGLAVLAFIACKEEQKEEVVLKDYVTFSGKIENPHEKKMITIMDREGFKKEIKMNDDGTFSDTLKVAEGKYMFTDGNEYGQLFLKNGFDIKMTLDTKQFDETMKFEGEGSEASNFFVANSLMQEEYMSEEALKMDKEAFTAHMEKMTKAFEGMKSNYPNLSSEFWKTETESLAKSIEGITAYHTEKIMLQEKFPAGTPSPSFAYNSIEGKEVKLEDLKGKYVYIDVWATWCGPCKVEIPHLKTLEKDYHDKNIEFVSISIDREKDKEKWVKMVADEELKGIQLFADNDWSSQFVKDYMISGIPRFILLDPKGNVVNADAPRPSSKDLVALFNELKI